jgi:hypothetical protein
MNRKHINIVTASAVAVAASLSNIASAVPVLGTYLEDQRCDPIPNQTLTHELGQVTFFPIDEALEIIATPVQQYVCVADDGIQNDWGIRITNISGQAWQNLFFVADLGLTVGNADGTVFDGPPGVVPTDAFRIDGTVTVTGMNDNLQGETGLIDEILSPGETWRFLLTNYADPAGLAPPPLFRAPGVFANSEPYLGSASISTASILATPVPEPTAIGLLAASATLLMRRRRK